jgi:hypothetical protein
MADLIEITREPPPVVEIVYPTGPQGPPGASNSIYTGTWRWTTGLVDAASSGRVGLNATSWTAATEIHLSKTTELGTDVSPSIGKLKVGDGLYLKDKANANKWAHYTIAANATDNGSWVSYPVTLVDASEPPPANNADTNVSLLVEGAQVEEWLSAPGPPATNTGNVGDWYLNETNGAVYEKTTDTTWTQRADLTGPQGPTGLQGPTGAASTVPGPPGPSASIGDLVLTSDSDNSGAGDIVFRTGSSEQGRLAVGGGLTLRPSANVVALTIQAGGSTDPFSVLAASGERLIRFQNVAPAPNYSPAIMFSATNGPGPNHNAWQLAIDVAAPTPYRDFVICKILAAGNASDLDGIYGSYNGGTIATPTSWGFGYAQPASTYRLRILSGNGDLSQGTLALHKQAGQTGRILSVKGGAADATAEQAWIDSDFSTKLISTPANRTFADATTTSGAATLTSVTANFTSADIGRPVAGTGIPAGAYISAVTNSTTATMSQNATASGTNVSVTIYKPQFHVTANSGVPLLALAFPSAGAVWLPQNVAVGVGAPATPAATLDIRAAGAADATLILRSVSQGGMKITSSGAAATVSIDTTNASAIRLGDVTATAVTVGRAAGNVSFYGATATAKLAVSGSRAGNAALASLLAALNTLGLITDSTTA